MNKVFLLGNVTRDVELRHSPKGTAITMLGMARNRKFKDFEGTVREETTFLNVEIYGKLAEACRTLTKGERVMVEGRLRLDEWEKDGVRKQKLVVVGDSVQFLGRQARRDEAQSPAPAARQDSAAPARDGDDIPF